MAQNGGPDDWDPVTVGRAVVVALRAVRWPLSATPDEDWITAFHNAPTNKSGSTEYVLTRSEPNVQGRDIKWTVGPDDHIDADIRVREKADAANAAYRGILKKRAAVRDQAAENKRAIEAEIEEAQRLLDEASG
jgi:hypothetical protein